MHHARQPLPHHTFKSFNPTLAEPKPPRPEFQLKSNCWDYGGEGRWSQKFSYLSLKQVKGTMIKGEHEKTSVDSVSLDFKTRPAHEPTRSKEEAIKLMEEMDDETIVKAWFKESGRKRTRVTRESEPKLKTPKKQWEEGAYKWHSIIEIKN
tara:strand:+ start:217 stop:669 length:453 start_codon:yes stop_codon:yes gene_type:complete